MSTANVIGKSEKTPSTKAAMQEQQSTTSWSEKNEKSDYAVLNPGPKAMSSQQQLIVDALEARANGRVDDSTVGFADEFRFKDHGIGLEFYDTKRLAEFFQKAQELYPDRSVEIDAIFASGDHVIAEWTLRTNLSEPFYGGLTRTVPISLRGASILRTEDGKIAEWADYYDGLTARQTALAAYFTEWVEL
jgi:steroid delta-isomerase-like uncharacterized protein